MSTDTTSAYEAEFIETRTTVRGRAARHLIAGDGPTIVHVHGAGGLRRAPVHDLLAADHRVVLVELPGFSADSPEVPDSAFGEYADELRERIAAATGGNAFTLVGTSFGARVAAASAAADANGIEALILLAPAIVMPPGFKIPGPGEPPAPISVRPGRIPAAAVDPAVLTRRREVSQRYLQEDITDSIRRLTVPTLVAFGTADAVTPPSLGRTFSELNSSIFLSFFYDSGHLIEFDRPEALANVIRNFAAYKDQYHLTRESGVLFP